MSVPEGFLHAKDVSAGAYACFLKVSACLYANRHLLLSAFTNNNCMGVCLSSRHPRAPTLGGVELRVF